MSGNPVLQEFEPTMTALDAMIKKLELNLSKNYSKSPFDAIRQKYGGSGAAAKAAPAEPKEEVKAAEKKEEAPAAAAGGKKDKKEKKEKKGGDKKEAKPAAEAAPELPDELEWWNSCDLRVGKIVSCEIVKDSDKLYLEKIDLGEGELRQIGSGVRKCISMEEMTKDALCVVFANLKARPLAGNMSHGMVLCAGTEDKSKIELMRPAPGTKIGERVMLDGNPGGIDSFFSQEMQPELKKKKTKYLENLVGLLKTNGDKVGTYNGLVMKTSAGPVTCDSLANVGIS